MQRLDDVASEASRGAERGGAGEQAAQGVPVAPFGLGLSPEGLPAGALQRRIQRRLLQRRADEGSADEVAGVHAAAERGTSGAGGALPHLDAIQRSFGRHDVSGVQAHTGAAATEASQAMGAEAYATGNAVAFAGTPSLHTVAHEAAHVVQQRAGVHLKGGVGEEGDRYEQHADAVADRVTRGESAEGLLDEMTGGGAAGASGAGGASGASGGPLQRKAEGGGEQRGDAHGPAAPGHDDEEGGAHAEGGEAAEAGAEEQANDEEEGEEEGDEEPEIDEPAIWSELSALGAEGAPPVQRLIKRPGGRGAVYMKFPGSVPDVRALTTAERTELRKLHDSTITYTLAAAIKKAKAKVAKGGGLVTGRAGTRIAHTKDMIRLVKLHYKFPARIKRKFKRHAKVWDVVLKNVHLMDSDIQALPSNTSESKLDVGLVKHLTFTVPTLINDIGLFNTMSKDMVQSGDKSASSLKGSMFESWTIDKVLSTKAKRATFDDKQLSAKRSSDGFDPGSGELWDMKHYEKKVAPSTNKHQADDYNTIMSNGIKSEEGYKVKSVNYLFPTEAAAKLNKWLKTTYGFRVWYIDDNDNKLYQI